MQDYDSQVEVFKALAHPARLQILELLRHEPACVCHLMAVLDRTQPYVSQQLAVLRDAGLVIDDKQGLNVFYQVRDRRIYELIDRVRGMLSLAAGEPGVPREGATAGPVRLAECPCPKCQAMGAQPGTQMLDDLPAAGRNAQFRSV